MPKSAGTTTSQTAQPIATGRVSTCLVELVLSAGEFGPQAEPALRQLRAALEAHPPVVGGNASGDCPSLSEDRLGLHAPGTILRTGMAVTQEFGKLDVTLRALVSTPDLIQGALLGAQHLRAAVGESPFLEQSVRASWS